DRLELPCVTWNDFCNPAIAPLGQSRSSRGSVGRKSAPAHKGFNTVGDRCEGSRTNIKQTQASGTRSRKWTQLNRSPSANTQFHVSDSNRRLPYGRGWSNAGLSPPVVDEARSLYFLSFSIYSVYTLA
ncbi:hypothetical protein PILCRDRAFT_829592, partial [Piloderma croceum F 1598]